MENNKFYLTCDCGCGETLLFVNDFGRIYIYFLTSLFCALQGNTNLRIKKSAIQGNTAFDICVREKDLISLSDFLKKCKFDKNENFNEERTLRFEINRFYDDIFSVEAYLTLSKDDIPSAKIYYAFDYSMNKQDTDDFVSMINDVFKQEANF